MTTVKQIIKAFNITTSELLEVISPEEKDIVYLSGSLIEGYGNKYSDLDVFIIKHDISNIDSQFRYEDFKIKLIYKGNSKLDFEYHEYSKVFNLIDFANSFDPDNLDSLENLSVDRIEFLHRFLVSIPIFNSEDYEIHKNNINKKNLYNALKYHRRRSFNAHLMDCHGMLENNDIDTAVFWSKQTLCDAIDVYLAAKGDTNTSQKWRLKRLERLDGVNSDLYIKFSELLNFCGRNENKRSYIESVLEFSHHLITDVEKNIEE